MTKRVKTGGRVAGTPNQATADIRAMCRKYSDTCVEQLIRIAQKSKSEGNKIAAISQILDRAYGKPSQAVIGDPDLPVKLVVTWEK